MVETKTFYYRNGNIKQKHKGTFNKYGNLTKGKMIFYDENEEITEIQEGRIEDGTIREGKRTLYNINEKGNMVIEEGFFDGCLNEGKRTLYEN